ncbi:MAG: hypothetical protein DHS80DRAFT_22646 [Piptocephalis tieghemiana]|nr:MAG: hypothetical protein DHS80DRAFT_22646 [Piptocephalis tieghemiana]
MAVTVPEDLSGLDASLCSTDKSESSIRRSCHGLSPTPTSSSSSSGSSNSSSTTTPSSTQSPPCSHLRSASRACACGSPHNTLMIQDDSVLRSHSPPPSSLHRSKTLYSKSSSLHHPLSPALPPHPASPAPFPSSSPSSHHQHHHRVHSDDLSDQVTIDWMSRLSVSPSPLVLQKSTVPHSTTSLSSQEDEGLGQGNDEPLPFSSSSSSSSSSSTGSIPKKRLLRLISQEGPGDPVGARTRRRADDPLSSSSMAECLKPDAPSEDSALSPPSPDSDSISPSVPSDSTSSPSSSSSSSSLVPRDYPTPEPQHFPTPCGKYIYVAPCEHIVSPERVHYLVNDRCPRYENLLSIIEFGIRAIDFTPVTFKTVPSSDLAKSEAKALSEVRGSPNIIRLLDAFSDSQGRQVFVLPRLRPIHWEGMDLADAQSRFHQILLALQHVHSRGWAHLDVNPSNILEDPSPLSSYSEEDEIAAAAAAATTTTTTGPGLAFPHGTSPAPPTDLSSSPHPPSFPHHHHHHHLEPSMLSRPHSRSPSISSSSSISSSTTSSSSSSPFTSGGSDPAGQSSSFHPSKSTARTVLIDFGLAKPLTGPIPRCGTPGYVAPEIYTGSADPAHPERLTQVDVYGLGILLGQILAPYLDGVRGLDAFGSSMASAHAVQDARESLAHVLGPMGEGGTGENSSSGEDLNDAGSIHHHHRHHHHHSSHHHHHPYRHRPSHPSHHSHSHAHHHAEEDLSFDRSHYLLGKAYLRSVVPPSSSSSSPSLGGTGDPRPQGSFLAHQPMEDDHQEGESLSGGWPTWARITAATVLAMTEPDPRDRATVDQLLSGPWIHLSHSRMAPTLESWKASRRVNRSRYRDRMIYSSSPSSSHYWTSDDDTDSLDGGYGWYRAGGMY